MGDIDRIEAARGGSFEFRLDGELILFSHPRDLTFQEVLGLLKEPRYMLAERRMPEWKRTALRDAWAARYDLPDFLQAQRLCYLVDRYAGALIYDLQAHAGVDLYELWHVRRWNTLLDLIDRLPRHSAFSAAVAKDEEHAAMLAEAMAARDGEQATSGGPPLETFTPEVEAITALRDDVRMLQYITRAAAGDKTAQAPKPLPRPSSPLEAALARAQFKRREAAHQSLVARLLPHKAASEGTPDR